jgi:hypothetical protein
MLGESAGRSTSNSPRRTARRRFEASERAQNTPLLDDPNYWDDEKLPVKKRFADTFFDLATGFVFGVLGIFFLALSHESGFVGRLAGGLLVTMLVCTAYTAQNLKRRR